MKSMQRNNEARVREVGNSERPIRKFRVDRLIIAKRESRMKPRLRSCPCPYHNNHASFPVEQPIISSTRHHFIFLFLIQLLIGLLQVDYQNKTVSPFETHPLICGWFLAAICVYCTVIAANLELQNHLPNSSQMVDHVILSTGALASVSLASVLFRPSLGWLCFCFWAVLPVTRARHLIKYLYECLRDGTCRAISLASNGFDRLWGRLTLKKQHLPM